ncbi:MAG TPA: regulatory protein RecX [Candidatus Angelobacter sp.]|nr:regulatory protein RecX [Candidatus Angelobacter sp.]
MPFKRPKPILDEPALYEYAIGALGRKMRTVSELKRLLRNRVPRDEAGEILVEMVILRLKEQKYLNDSSYAASYSVFRRDNEKFGPRRVVTDLKVKGIHPEVIEKAVQQAYSDVSEEEQARAFLKRKRLKKPGTNQETARIFRTLMRAGFRSGVAIQILKNWDVDDEVLTVLQEESPDGTESQESSSDDPTHR